MTKPIDIKSLAPGRQLDALVAERFMGWVEIHGYGPVGRPSKEALEDCIVPPYSTDISAAWTVVEKLNSEWLVELHGSRGHGWAVFLLSTDSIHEDLTFKESLIGFCPTAMLAICRTALLMPK